jgi:RNA polymerase sigma-54 factor
MKQSLQLKLSQHLTLTPQLQQSIRLLQLSTTELNQELERFLMENPLLEREETYPEAAPAAQRGTDAPVEIAQTAQEKSSEQEQTPDASAGDSMSQEDWFSGTGNRNNRDDGEDGDFPQAAAIAPTLREHLLSQVSLLILSERDRQLVTLLIESLDEDGYLTQSLEELFDMLPPELAIEQDDLAIALKHLQHLDPAGVGARTPAECLALQLEALPERGPTHKLALAVVREHLSLLAARDFARIKRQLGCSDEELRAAHRLIQSLNPHPGADYERQETRYVIPDVTVRKIKNVWTASLNAEAVPKLRVNKLYADILQNQRGASSGHLSQQLQEARWLVKNIQQRFETILRVSQAIVDRQRNFFEHGEVAMRPLVLREIAETLGLHESTISRVTTQKFMLTPRGIFELKYFFSSHVATETGGACSATAIRALIKQLVAAEDARKPLSDSKIADILGQQGIVVARRTIAKYREALHISPVSQRKSF